MFGRLNVGFEAMEPELVEATVEDQRERLGHQPSVFASCESIKAQVRALEDAHDGLTMPITPTGRLSVVRRMRLGIVRPFLMRSR